MRKIKDLFSKWQFRLLLVAVPCVLGVWGFYAYYTVPEKTAVCPWFSALYSTVRLFGMSFDGSKNPDLPQKYVIILEIARFLAPLFTGTALYKLIKPYLLEMKTKARARRTNAVAVHGCPDVTAALKANLKSYAVIGPDAGNERFSAKKQIIAFDDDRQSLRFLNENESRLLGKKADDRITYICLHSPKYRLTNSSKIRVSCLSVNCARLFWEKYYLKRFGGKLSAQNPENPDPERTKVVLIGFGVYGEALLTQSLLVNVFLKGTPGVEYHVFGDGSSFCQRYPKLGRILSSDSTARTGDTLTFHGKDEILSSASVYEGAERIIIADDDDTVNYAVFSDLCHLLVLPPPVYIRLKTETVTDNLFKAGDGNDAGGPLCQVGYTVFGTNDELYSEDAIISKKLRGFARELNEYYRKRSGDGDGWNELGTVRQRANISAADHSSVKVRQLLKTDCPFDKNSLVQYQEEFGKHRDDSAWLEPYQELEHERWCRFYYMEGWDYSADRDDQNRKHDCLTDYGNLGEDVKAYDLDSYLALYEFRPES